MVVLHNTKGVRIADRPKKSGCSWISMIKRLRTTIMIIITAAVSRPHVSFLKVNRIRTAKVKTAEPRGQSYSKWSI